MQRKRYRRDIKVTAFPPRILVSQRSGKKIKNK